MVLTVFAISNASAQCTYTSLSDGNFFNADGTIFNAGLFSRTGSCNSGDNISNSVIIINHNVVLNGNLSSTGAITITAGGSLRQDATRRILTIRGGGNGSEIKLTLLTTPTAQRNASQLSVGILDLRAATVNVGVNSTLGIACTLYTGNQVTINLGNNSLLNVFGDVDLSNTNSVIDGPNSGSPAGLRVVGRLRGNGNAASNLFEQPGSLNTCVQGVNPITCSTATGNAYTPTAAQNNDPTCVSVLPVTLTRFVGQWAAGGAAVNLKWSTATELDNDYFAVERSTDGVSFEKIAQVAGAGNSSMLRNYAYTDASPLAISAYYRLRQVDYDGTATYSPIISLGTPQSLINWLVATSSPRHFTIQRQLDASSQFEVLDVTGRLMFSQAVSTENADVVIPSLPTGVYFFRLMTKQERFTIRQVVTAGN